MSKDRDGTEDDPRLVPDVGEGDAQRDVVDDETPAESEPDIVADFGPEQSDELLVTGDLEDQDALETPAEDFTDDLSDDDLSEEDVDDEQDADAAVAVGASAGVAGSNRAAAKLAGSRTTATTSRKEAPTKPRETSEQAGVFARIGRFVREVVAELRKVIWPSRKQWATFTLVVILFLIVMTALVAGLDVLFHLIVGEVFS